MPKITKTKEQQKALARTSELLKRLNKMNQIFEAAPESGRSEKNVESAEITVVVAGVKAKIPVTVETVLDVLSDIRKKYCAEVRNSEKKFNIELDEQDHDIFIGVSKSGNTNHAVKDDATEDQTLESEEMGGENETGNISETSQSQDFIGTDWGESGEVWHGEE